MRQSDLSNQRSTKLVLIIECLNILGPYSKGCIFTQDTNKQKLLAGNHPNGPDVGRIVTLMGPSTLRLVLVKHSPKLSFISFQGPV